MRRFILGWAIAAVACLQPALAVASDQEIAQRIADALRSSGQMVDYSVGVKYQDGTAWLSGRVASDEQLERAIEITESVGDVSLVVSHLEVRSNVRPDASQDAPPAAAPQGTNPVVRLATPPASVQQSVNQVYYAPENQAAPTEPRPLAVPAPTRMQNTAPQANGQTPRGVPLPQYMPQAQQPYAPQPQQQVAPQARPQYVPQNRMPQSARVAQQPQRMPQQYQQAPAQYQQQYQQPVRMAANYSAQGYAPAAQGVPGTPVGYYGAGQGTGVAPAAYDQPYMPNYAWPAYAAYPNYAGVTYPKQYSPSAWPYIGPFYPYPQVPLGWRKVTLEWDDGWWFLDFDDRSRQ